MWAAARGTGVDILGFIFYEAMCGSLLENKIICCERFSSVGE